MWKRSKALQAQYPDASKFVESKSLPNIIKALAMAHTTFCTRTKSDRYEIVECIIISLSTIVLFVVQPNERNVADQRHLEIGLAETYNVQVVRATLTECTTHLTHDSEYNLQ